MLGATLDALHAEMGEVFWNPVVDLFFLQLLVNCQSSGAWQMPGLPDADLEREEVKLSMLVLKLQNDTKPYLFDLLGTALVAVHQLRYKHPLDDMDELWAIPKARRFLCVAAALLYAITQDEVLEKVAMSAPAYTA